MMIDRIIERTARQYNLVGAMPLHDLMPKSYRDFHGIDSYSKPERHHLSNENGIDPYETDRMVIKTARRYDLTSARPLSDLLPRSYKVFHGLDLGESESDLAKPLKHRDNMCAYYPIKPKKHKDDDYMDSILHPRY